MIIVGFLTALRRLSASRHLPPFAAHRSTYQIRLNGVGMTVASESINTD